MLDFPPIPDKEFFSIGEASRIAQIPAYVLRYWESEFKLLRPARRTSGQRKYIRKDIETIFRIKDLLYSRKFTIAGAKKHLLDEKRKDSGSTDVQLNFEIQQPASVSASSAAPEVIKEVREELQDLLKMLK
ncbi:MAG: MerR family transcriptional regulator [Elusimicrobiota bacterium]